MNDSNNKKKKVNRTREKRLTVRFSKEEYMLMKKKMEIEGYDNFNEYARKKTMYGWIIVEDYIICEKYSKKLKEIAIDIQKIADRADLIEEQEEKIRRGEKVENIEPQISLAEIKAIEGWMKELYELMSRDLETKKGKGKKD